MIPNTSVSPAANKNSSSPNCRPLRHCSRKKSIIPSTYIVDDDMRDTVVSKLSCFMQPDLFVRLQRYRIVASNKGKARPIGEQSLLRSKQLRGKPATTLASGHTDQPVEISIRQSRICAHHRLYDWQMRLTAQR